MPRIAILFSILLSSLYLNAQQPVAKNSSDIYESVQKLNFLGTALYLAAHPDDENTGMIAYLSNEVKARTAYLSLTRGDGGQNLIGTELRELLGVLRTEELLAARRIDGGEQFFSRANDFGYSKHPDETLDIWDKEKVLGDVIWTIRNFKPDIIINRFDHRTAGSTHGHHTTSAMLSVEAFDLAANPNSYPNQLQTTTTWQPKRMFFNTSWWFYGSQEKFDEADKSKLTAVNTGVYYPLKGKSNNEISSLSRSQHRCQGFGMLSSRGDNTEYLELIKGDLPKNKNLFEGINTTWSRVEGGKAIGKILKDVETNFDFKHPENHLPQLLEAYQLISKLKDEYWSAYKTNEIKNIIAACAGLYLEANAKTQIVTPGDQVTVTLEMVNRNANNIKLVSITSVPENKQTLFNINLSRNQTEFKDINISIPKTQEYTAPYWLTEEGTTGMYTVNSPLLIGKPETPRAAKVIFRMEINNTPITFTKDVVYKYASPDYGELYEPFEIVPDVALSIPNKVSIFSTNTPQPITITLKALKNNVKGTATLKAAKGWSITPATIPFTIDQKNSEVKVTFTVTPPKEESVTTLQAIASINGKEFDQSMIEVNYEHIPKQSVLLPATSKLVHMQIEKSGNYIGYIAGAGDEIPESLRQIGYVVQTIDPKNITKENLNEFDAIVVGIRAYNTVYELEQKQQLLFDYVEQGGTMIVQYNTHRRLINTQIAPYNLHLSYDRVTDENAEVSFINPKNELLNYPNKITTKDFEGWTQERGLYFPDEWDEAFTPVLSMHDKNEDDKKGSLLIAPYGKGHYIYTGLSFFRELPAGVPGAYKLFSNMLSVGKEKKSTQIKG